MSHEFSLDVRFYRLSPALEPFFTALYCFTIECADDVVIIDCLHPEWAALRFTQYGAPPVAGLVGEEQRAREEFVASGPTSRSIGFGLRRSRIWGLGLLPLGWAHYTRYPAHHMADQIGDGSAHEALEIFRPLMDIVRGSQDEPDRIAARIERYLLHCDLPPVRDAERILACQLALQDPDVANVDELASVASTSRRTLERMCADHFGFAPKMLLRRQRFLRSLARYMLRPELNWSTALDRHYFDQAHFVHDFRKFMGMSPSEYADMPHPILDRIMAQRMADQGAVPATDLPTVLRYTAPPGEADEIGRH